MKGMLACCAALLAVLAMPTIAAGKAGALDRGFNGDGKVVTAFPVNNGTRGSINYTLPFEYARGRVAMALSNSGKLVLANSKAIAAFQANGRRNSGFGGSGAVPIGPIEGARFQLADIAIDSQNRVLVAGTAKPTDEYGLPGQPLPGPIPTLAAIRRYLPNGQLDPSFGVGGVVLTNLDAPPPTFEGQAYKGSAVAVVGLAIDRADRPIVTGSAVVEVGQCPNSQDRFEASHALVARLTVNGAPDTSFAGNGTKTIGGPSWFGLPQPTSAGVVVVGSGANPCPHGGPPYDPSTLASIGNDGSFAQGFSGDGLWSRPFASISDVAVDPSGKLILLTRTIELSGGEWYESAGKVVRLRRNGSLDPNFGRRGQALVQLPKHSSLEAIATDTTGRVVMAGVVRGKSRGEKKVHLKFLLIRTTTDGRPDPHFGHHGRVATSFGSRTNVRPTDVLVDRANRIVVGGTFSDKTIGNAFAVARYLGGH